MVERGILTLKEILSAFPPEQKTITGKNGEVPYRIYRDPSELILYAVPEAVWLKRGEQPENQAVV